MYFEYETNNNNNNSTSVWCLISQQLSKCWHLTGYQCNVLQFLTLKLFFLDTADSRYRYHKFIAVNGLKWQTLTIHEFEEKRVI
jgi:hypothetical protein